MKRRLFRNRKTRYAGIAAVLTVLVIAVVILTNTVFGSLANRYEWYTSMNARANYDVTTVCYNLLDSAFASMDADNRSAPVEIIFCDTEEMWTTDETQNYVYHTAKSIDERYENVTLSFYDIKINPNSVKQYAIDDETGNPISILDSDVIIACEDYHRQYKLEDFFAFYDNANTEVWAYDGERTLAAGILRAINRVPQTVCLTSDHGELFYDYELIRLLDDAGYQIVSDFSLSDDPIPNDCSLIITYNPNSDLNDTEGLAENEKLDRFLAEGGNNYLVFLSNGTPRLSNLERYLKEWGVETSYFNNTDNGKLYRYTVQDLKKSLTSDGYTIYGELSERASGADSFGGLADSVVFKNATALAHTNDFIASEDGSYIKGNRTMYSVYNASSSAELWANGEVRGGDSAMLMTVTEQKNDTNGVSRVCVVASAEFVSREQVQSAVLDNPDVMQRLFGIMGQDYPTEGIKLKPFGTMQISTITTSQMLRWTISLTVIPAFVVAVTGIVILVKRRRTQY